MKAQIKSAIEFVLALYIPDFVDRAPADQQLLVDITYDMWLAEWKMAQAKIQIHPDQMVIDDYVDPEVAR